MKSCIFLMGFFLLAGCSSAPEKSPPTPVVRVIDKETAMKMVSRYLMQRMGYASYSAPADGGTVWIFRVSTGELGGPIGPESPVLIVDKCSGYISWGAQRQE